jgi:putative DNA primase/helicase
MANAKPTDDELAVRWIKREEAAGRLWLYPDQWMRYENGIWVNGREGEARQSVSEILKAAKSEGIRPTKARLSSVFSWAAESPLWKDPDLFDNDPDLLVCNNGTLHLPTRKLGPHSPKHYMTQKVHYNYDPSATADTFKYALSCVADKDTQQFLQEFAGYCLTTDTRHEIAVWFTGPPGSGKSTLVEGFQAMAGDMTTTLGLAQIENSRFALGDLQGKRLAISTEQPGAYMQATSILNAVISGEEVTIERKFQNPLIIRPVAKVLWAMNALPRVQNAGDGLFRRVKIVKFPAIPKDDQDPAIKEAIRTEGAGILNWALEGLDQLRKRGGFNVSKGVKMQTAAFKMTADVPAAFIDDACDLDPQHSIQSSHLYQEYKNWAIKNGHKPQSITSIAEDWERLGLVKNRSAAGVFWDGIKLKMRTP